MQLGLAQQVQPEAQKQPVLLGLAGQAPPKLFAEVDRAHSAGPFAEQVPARPAAQVQLDELSAEVVGAHSAEAKVQPELLGLAQVQPEAQVQPGAAQVQPVLSELEGQVQPELLAQVDGAHSAGLFAEQVPARLAAKLELSAEVVRAQSAEAQAEPELLGLAQQVQPKAQAQPELGELSAEVVRAHSAEAQAQPELLGLAQQVQPKAQAQPELGELSAEVVRAHSAEAQAQPVLLGLAQQVQPEAQVQPVLLELAGQVQPELFAQLERAHSAGPFAEQVPARLVQLELSAEVVRAHFAAAQVQPVLEAQVQPVLSELARQVQPELFAEVDRAHSAGPFAEQVPARLAAQLELSAEVVRAQSAQAQVQPELLGLAPQPEAQAQPEEAQQADKAGPGLRHCWLRAEQVLVLPELGQTWLVRLSQLHATPPAAAEQSSAQVLGLSAKGLEESAWARCRRLNTKAHSSTGPTSYRLRRVTASSPVKHAVSPAGRSSQPRSADPAAWPPI